MTERLGFKSWATGALVLAAVAACGHSGSDPSADPTSPLVSSPSPSASSSAPASPKELAAAEATQKVKDYYGVLDELGQDPTSSLKPLGSVAIGIMLNAERHLVQGEHARGERQIGDVKLVDVTVQSVGLDNSAPNAGRVPTVVIDVCHDVSGTDVVDKTGKSVVLSTRPVRAWSRFWVVNYSYAKHPHTAWRVENARDLTRPACAA